jgi:iron-sulfur cluster assembly accessory protein
MTTTNQRVSREMTIKNILSLFPNKAERLAHEITRAGLHCVGCHAAVWETLEAGMLGHGMGEEQIERLVERLNALLDEESDPETISLTPLAAQKYREILQEEGKPGWGIRFEERMAGCSGFEYVLDFSEKAGEEDEVFVSEDIEIHIHKNNVPRLKGCRIDYIDDGLNGSGFKIDNPNVVSACGCGSSHNYGNGKN